MTKIILSTKKSIKKILLRALRNRCNSPHQIAMGVSIGTFIGLGPTFGFQLIPVLFFCYFFKLNKIAGTFGVFITNPFTVIPIYLFNYWIGNLFFAKDVNAYKIIKEAVFSKYDTFTENLKAIYFVIIKLGSPFLVGCFINATIFSFIAYFTVRKIVNTFLIKRQLLLEKKKRKKKKFKK